MKQKKQKKILVFGYFGYRTNQLDGQTVKTRAIYDLVNKRYDGKVVLSDSQEFRYSLKSIIKFLKGLFSCKIFIWLPAHNNLKYLFPFIFFLSKIVKFEIIYVVIGGWLSGVLESLPFHRKQLKKIRAILVENKTTVDELAKRYNFKNLDVIPNFRSGLSPLKIRESDGQFKIVFMARINKLKGLDTINELAYNLPKNVVIDFYGPINKPDKDFFEKMLDNKSLHYNGCLLPDEINSVLGNYDCLILPTHYYTEGFPGSILDAFRAGIPVIVTNWKHAHEFVTDGKTGFVVDFEKPIEGISNAIQQMIEQPFRLKEMKTDAYKEAFKYTDESAWQIINKYLLD